MVHINQKTTEKCYVASLIMTLLPRWHKLQSNKREMVVMINLNPII